MQPIEESGGPSGGRTGGDPVLGTLRSTFGHAAFRPGQAPLVRAALRGRDLLAVLPTGGGKSLCFQLPALLASGTTVVVSPLIALMQDQVTGLIRRGVPAASLTSHDGPASRSAVEAAIVSRRLRLLYLSPERLSGDRVRRLLARVPPARVVVDEAHCISEWGHDFRPAFRRVVEALPRNAGVPVSAFTATATPRTRRDIEAVLELRSPLRVVRPVDRRNLRYEARRARDAREGMAWIERRLRSGQGTPAIVYVLSRLGAVRIADRLRRLGVRAAAYHAGMPAETRRRLQQEFLAGRWRVMCATCAFGMGIDHPSIRLVAHFGMPAALETYVQEAGRAGRDGEPARCLLVELPGDARLHRARLRRRVGPRGSARSPALREQAERLRAMRRYVRGRQCRRAAIAAWFGERAPACAGCDRCPSR